MYAMNYPVVASQKETHPQAPFWIAANRPKGPFGAPPDKVSGRGARTGHSVSIFGCSVYV